jgi:hypothetical protein
MRHTIDDLLGIVYRYYPRGSGSADQLGPSLRTKTAEHARLVAARCQAATDERWHALRQRVAERFPGLVVDQSLSLATGACDACYSVTIPRPDTIAHAMLWFRVSFLAPYYIVYKSRIVDVASEPEGFNVVVKGIPFYVPRSAMGSELVPFDEEMMRIKRQDITFALAPDEQLYAEWISRDIEATFECEPMPHEVGTVLVPEVETGLRVSGDARIYDALFTDSHQWVKPVASDVKIRVDLDANRLPEPTLAVLTVLAAFYSIGLALAGPEVRASYWRASSDGILHKEELLRDLGRMRSRVESPVSLRAADAAREFGALLTEWDGKGAPSSAVLAWASRVLAECPYVPTSDPPEA